MARKFDRVLIGVSPRGELVDERTNVHSCTFGGTDGPALLIAADEGVFGAFDGVDGTAGLLTTEVGVPT